MRDGGGYYFIIRVWNHVWNNSKIVFGTKDGLWMQDDCGCSMDVVLLWEEERIHCRNLRFCIRDCNV